MSRQGGEGGALREGEMVASLVSREGGEGRTLGWVVGGSRMGEVESEAAVSLTPGVSSGDMSWSVAAFSSSSSPWEARLEDSEVIECFWRELVSGRKEEEEESGKASDRVTPRLASGGLECLCPPPLSHPGWS